jgi:hypothetical protein
VHEGAYQRAGDRDDQTVATVTGQPVKIVTDI